MKEFFYFLAFALLSQVECQDFSRVPLGMSNGFIKNDQITATSKFAADYYGYTARLKLTGIRWCSVIKYSGAPVNYSEYVQVDFKSVVTLTGIATQGDDNYAANYVKKYYLEVSMDGSQYRDVKGSDGNRQVFTGNTNNNGIVYNWLTAPARVRFVRFRATDVSGNHICVRLEFYGGRDSQAAGRAIYPLGMENGVIEDSQLSHSSELNNNPSRNGRLNRAGAAWCVRRADNNEWLQIDFKQPLVITAIATQGHGIASSRDRTYKYYLQYREVGSTTFQYAKNSTNGNMLFTGNYKFQNLIVMNLLPVAVTTQFLRINPITGGYLSPDKCLRAEVYGYHPECAGDLTLLDSTKLVVSSSTSATYVNGSIVHSRYAWCASTAVTTEYIKADLGSIRRITGFGIQGDSENDQWPTKIKIGVSNSSSAPVEMATEYIGTFGRFHVTRHWFKDHIYARYIQFRPTEVNGGSSVCMRIQVLGCLDFSRVPLGMSNGFIKNDQITATSKFAADYYGYTARLKLTGIRWCSVIKYSGAPVNYSEYVQVDFKSVVTLTGIATQGDDNYAANYVKKYYLEVSMDGSQYSDVNGSDGNRQVFTGNTDNTGIVYAWLTAPTRARFVRFRASDVSGAHICVRMEYYGSRDSQAASKVVYPLGMESGVIEDSQLSNSNEFNGNPARNGRLHRATAGWCAPNGNNNEWMQIDFKQPMVVAAIATQGHSGGGSVDRTYKYYLQYREVGSTTFKYAVNSTDSNVLFTGNYKFQNLVVMNLLPVPVTTQFLRINPITFGLGSAVRCLRAEVYGYHPVCSDDLTGLATITASSSSEAAQHSFIYSRSTWCASSSDYLDVDLLMPRMVTSVGIQGDSNNDQWVKTFELSHGLSRGSMQQTGTTYTANSDRNSVVRNWLLPPLFARFIRISVDTFQTAACMRIQILGCSKDHAVLRSITSTVVNMRTAAVSWDVVYNASSSFTLQYRKIENQAWTEIANLNSGSVSVPNLEKYQNYIVRLKSSKGILMLKNYAFGGAFSETSKFKLEIDPRIKPKQSSPAVVTVDTVTIFWQRLTQNEILDWDVKGFNIIYKCTDDSGSINCDAKEVNISNAEAANFTASNLMQYTNYTFTVSVFNPIAKGPMSTINVKTEMKKIEFAPKVHSIRPKTSSLELILKDDNRFIVSGYRVAFRCTATSKTRDCVSSMWTNLTLTKSSTTIYGLMSWTKYELRITAFNQVGDSPVNISFTTTLETAPSVPPTAITATNINATAVAFSLQTLEKNDTNGELVAFSVKLVRLDTSMEIQRNISSSLQNFTASGLKTYANYSIRIAAVNRAGVGPYSTSVIIETLQSAPSGSPIISSVQSYKFSVTLSITNINKEQENGPLLGYRISYSCVNTAVTRECSSTALNTRVVTGSGKTALNLGSLSSWTRYSVKVKVYNKIGDGPYSAIVNFTTLEEPPSVPPTGITVTHVNATAVAFSWQTLEKNNTNGELVAFSVKLVRQDTSMEIQRNISSSLQNFTASGLKTYANYSIRIAAVNRAGVGPYSTSVIIETLQSAPTASPTISVVQPDTFSAMLSITNINKEQENGPLLGYRISYECVNTAVTRRCSSTALNTQEVTGNGKTELNLGSLSSWTRYSLKVTVYNKIGDGPYSAIVNFTTLEEPPSKSPKNISLEVTSSRSLRVRWENLDWDDRNGILTLFSLRLMNETTVIEILNISAVNSGLNFTGLWPYSSYSFVAAAINSAGLGPYSVPVYARTMEEAPGEAPTITNITTQKYNFSLAVKNINKRMEFGKVIGYHVLLECVPNGNMSQDCPGNSTKIETFSGYPRNLLVVSNVTPWTKYRVHLQIFNSAGVSILSEPLEGVTKEDYPSAAPSDITIDVKSSKSVHIKWKQLAKQDTNGLITSYTISLRYKRRGVPKSMSVETSGLSAVLSNLIPYTVYNISIKAKNSAGYGPESGLKSNRTKEDGPSPPYDVRAIPQGSTSMKVIWKKPLDPNGIIRKYTLQHCKRNCNSTTLLGNVTETVLFGLEADVNYTFKVVAHTIKIGNWSVTIVQQTLEGIPSEPRTFSIATRESTFLILNWLEPAFPRGRIISYQILGNGTKSYRPTFSREIQTTYSCTPSCQTSYNLSNLVPGTYYTVKIAARTSKGQGPFSLVTNGWTRIAAASPPDVTNVTSFKNGGTEVNITVKTVSNLNGPISHYEMIVQTRTGTETPMKTFLSLKSKADAVEDGLNYYLMASRKPGEMPLFMQITPGIAWIDALGDNLETPGKYFLHFRAVSKRKNEIVNGRATVVDLERTFLKKLPEPKGDEIKASTITISLDVTLPSGFTPSYYYVIAIKITDSKKVQDPSTYKQEDLKKYQPNLENTPYIAAVLTHDEVIKLKNFEVGNGMVTKSTTKRRRRLSRATVEEYRNQPLDPESTYSVFIRVHSTTSSPFSTPWTIPVTTKPKPKPLDGPGTNAVLPIVITVVAVIILVAIIAVFVFRRRRRKPPYKNRDSLNATELKEVPDGRGHLNRVPSVDSQSNGGTEIPFEPVSLRVTKSQRYPPFPAKDIVQIFNRRSEGDDTGFKEEFETLPKEQLFTWRTGEDQRNKARNRFANIISYDFNRVELKQTRNKSNYINASYVVDYFGQKRYIACQAPIPSTVDDFWAMMWEQNIRGIVMLTRCVEGPKKKSEEYWPRSGSAVYDSDGYQIHVKYCGIEEYPDYIFTTLEMTVGNTRRKLYHLHFIAWPDYGIPEYPTSLLSFRRRVRNFIPWEKQGNEPIVVHCSAGVGRTGTFLAIDTLIPLIEKSKIIDVYGYVYLLRLQRSQMVQRDAQYKFIFECLLEATVCGITEISVQEFKKKYDALFDVDPRAKKGGIVREFTSLSIVATAIPDEEFSSARLPANEHKNRDITVLPKNTQRLFLPSLSSEEGCNYINATFADGNSKDQFVVTQSPLENTVKDFWRMVIERGSTTIVSLTEANEIYPKYYPSVGEAHYDDGKISVQLISFEEIANGVVKSILTAYDQPFNRSLDEVHHYHLSTWIDRSVPSDITSLVSLIEATESTQRRLRGGPIIVHCGNGGGRSGTFVAAYTILERLKSEQMVDVFQTVRRLRKCRPSFVENKEQYKFLYDVVSCYLEQFSAYSNF